jgi:hypothetical protein
MLHQSTGRVVGSTQLKIMIWHWMRCP